jgi:hypothetical protein
MKNQTQHLILMLFFVCSILVFNAIVALCAVRFSDIFDLHIYADVGNFEGNGWARASVEGETGPYTLLCCSGSTHFLMSLPLGIFLTNIVHGGTQYPPKSPTGAPMRSVILSKYQTTPSPQRMKRD